ncbi:MAG TPA: aldose epimerase family protein, partial [Segetibacter sp.]
GFHGFNKKVWEVERTIENDDNAGIVFSYLSKNGEEGYPGNLSVTVTYLLNRNNELSIQFNAVTDEATIVSLTNHSYFNLSGFEDNTIHNHILQINADSYTVKNDNNTSSGEIALTEETPLHFYTPKTIGEDIHQLESDMGYDHNFVLKNDHQNLDLAAQLYHEGSGRLLKIFTNQPGVQMYTANWWDGTVVGYQDKPYKKHGAVALETQAFPDAPNHPSFPNAVLKPGEVYNKLTVFKFLNDKTIEV